MFVAWRVPVVCVDGQATFCNIDDFWRSVEGEDGMRHDHDFVESMIRVALQVWAEVGKYL